MQTTAPSTKGAAEPRHAPPGSPVASLRQAVADSGLPELAGEVRLDDCVRVAADLLATPLVAVSLFDGQRERLIARVGWDVAELPGPVALGGALTSRGPGVQVVADAREDSVLREHPLVAGHATVRFCAAAPLVDGAGTVWGAFLAADRRPRTLRPAERRLLEFLAAQVLRLLEAVRRTHRLAATVAEHEHVRESLRLRTNLLQLQQVIAAAANESTSLPEVLESVLQLVGAYTGWPLGHAWLLAENARRPSEPARLWQAASSARYDGVIKAVEHGDPETREQRLRELAGDELAIRTDDLGGDSAGPVAAAARAAGLAAAVVVPVGTGGRIDAMLAFFSVEAEPLNDRLSQVLAYIATQVGRVIERRLAEAALRQSEESFRALIENGSDVIAILDGKGTIRYVSPSVERILARHPPELTGRSGLTLVHPGDLARTTAVLARLVANPGQTMILEFRVRHADGSYRTLEGLGRYATDAGSGFKGIIATFRDLTERKRTEAELQQTNRRLTETMAELQRTQQQVIQQERLRALGQMASGIAHDFNNALAPILGFSELLLQRPETRTNDAKAVQFLQMMHTAATDAARVVARLREFYRNREEADRLQPVDVRRLIGQAIALTEPRWRQQALARGVTIQVATEVDEVAPVAGNESDLREMLTNLIFNAVDAMPQGGTLTLRARPAGSSVELVVADSGNGMTEDVRRRCFEPFFTTKGQQGTGLGLGMVHGIVRRHEGQIEVDSSPGQGTQIRIRLPTVSHAPEPATASSPSPPTRPLRVLLVDDDALVREIEGEYLRADGHEVITADSGPGALELFHARPFDLVILDHAMPVMNGAQVAAAIKQVAPATPVLLLTGFGDLMRAEGENVASVDNILSKPINLEQLRAAVAAATAGKDNQS